MAAPSPSSPSRAARWVVRLTPFTSRFVAAKVRPHRRIPNAVEVIGDNSFDVHDDVCALIREFGGRPPDDMMRPNPYRRVTVGVAGDETGPFTAALIFPGCAPVAVGLLFARRATAVRHAAQIGEAFGLELSV